LTRNKEGTQNLFEGAPV